MAVQEACGMDMKLMQHCRQCRADAVGLIGEDRGQEFTKDVFSEMSFDDLEQQAAEFGSLHVPVSIT